MAILTGSEILKQISEKHIRIGNFDEKRIQPNSYDTTLGNKISYYKLNDKFITIETFDYNRPFTLYGQGELIDHYQKWIGSSTPLTCSSLTIPYLDSRKENPMFTEDIPEEGFLMLPGILYLVETVESVWSDKYVVEISGTSSLARLGITVHKTAGYANIGHEFKWILEVEVTHPIKIYSGMKIGQMYFHTVEGETNLQYHGKYSDKQMGDELCGSLNHQVYEIDPNESSEELPTEPLEK